MKKFYKFLMCLWLLLTVQVAFAYEDYDFNAVKENQQVNYSPELKTWNFGVGEAGNITLTKKMSVGTGGFSQYYYSDNKLASQLGSNYEFITLDGRLIACHNADLKLFEMFVENGKLVEHELTQEQIQQLFPDVEIVKISDFKNKQITICKKPFKTKEFLLLNDTDEFFYKYSFKPRSVKRTWIAGLIKVERYEQIIFSHYNDDNSRFPAYTINVGFSLR